MSKRFKNKVIFLTAAFLCFLFIPVGCSSKNTDTRSDFMFKENAKLIYEETLSPNKAYITSDEDIVYYNIKVYQDDNFAITVNASTNSEFFKEQQYTLDYDKEIAEEDVTVNWTTLMGNPEASEDDQFAVARVSISDNGVVFSERKINFAKNAIEIMIDTINRNK